MRPAAPILLAVVVLGAAGFVAGRQGGAEPARSETAAPSAFQPAAKAPPIAALRAAPAPPALAREKKKRKKKSSAATSAGATASTPTVVTPPPYQAPVQSQLQSPGTSTPPASSPGTSSPPDLGTRDE